MDVESNADVAIINKVYNNHYFRSLRLLQTSVGLWPYESGNRRKIRQVFVSVNILLMMLPVVVSGSIWCGLKYDICSQNVVEIVFLVVALSKYLVTLSCEDKLKKIYKQIAIHWASLTDQKEKDLMIKYAIKGKKRSSFFIGFVFFIGFSFTLLPLTVDFMNIVNPLNESRQRFVVVTGEYYIDPLEHYFKLYIFFIVTCITICLVVSSVDSTYMIVTHQTLGMYSVVKNRIEVATMYYDPNSRFDFIMITEAIRLHQKALEFITLIESSYSFLFLVIIVCTIGFLSIVSLVAFSLLEMNNKFDLVRLAGVSVVVIIHLMFLSWPGQLILDCSHELFIAVYATEWYNISEAGKKLLNFLMLRSARPSMFTAGGLYIINFENFLAIMKTTMSYVAVMFSIKE